jgi:hypothetical protein
MKKKMMKYLWKNHPDFVLNKKGFKNNIIHNDKKFLDLYVDIHYSDAKALLGIREMYNIYKMVEQSEKIDGDIAEVGVYKGGSARIICELKGRKTLHLFDTFEGMPQVNTTIDSHRQGDFNDTSLDRVRSYLMKFDNVHFYKGIFPESAKDLMDRSCAFSFVNLDVDIYESTREGLMFFYPRMSKGGIMMSHDYRSISCPGVKKAFDEFFYDKPEPIIELWDSQCCVVKF